MTNKHEVFDVHRDNPTWCSEDIARHLGCLGAYVRATAQRNGWTLPNRNHATVEETAARRAALDLLASLDEILHYDGGAQSALEDEYVMERAHAAFAKAQPNRPQSEAR